MDDFYETRNSIYCYKNTSVLINKLDIKDSKKLFKLENRIALARLYELRQNNNLGDFSVNHLKEIHRHLFEDIYPFAGKFRKENIAKDNFRFAEWEYIEQELIVLLDKLKSENYMLGLEKDIISNKIAYYMSELNVLHPFREGNGRTIREFIRQLALKNGYILNLVHTESKELLNASIESVIDTNKLEKILYNCLEKIQN